MKIFLFSFFVLCLSINVPANLFSIVNHRITRSSHLNRKVRNNFNVRENNDKKNKIDTHTSRISFSFNPIIFSDTLSLGGGLNFSFYPFKFDLIKNKSFLFEILNNVRADFFLNGNYVSNTANGLIFQSGVGTYLDFVLFDKFVLSAGSKIGISTYTMLLQDTSFSEIGFLLSPTINLFIPFNKIIGISTSMSYNKIIGNVFTPASLGSTLEISFSL